MTTMQRRALLAVLASAEVKQKFTGAGSEPNRRGPREFADYVNAMPNRKSGRR